jgi:hypothetical protein
MIEHLVGVQAQEPQAPYVGLWTRLQRFRPEDLSDLVAHRKAVRGGLMRSTIHLVGADDYALLWPLMRAVLTGTFRGSQFRRELDNVPVDEVLALGRRLLAEQPRTRAELSPLLAERWPGIDPPSLAYAISFLTPVVQVPPRGLWRRSGPARWAVAETLLQREFNDNPAPDKVIVRYLAAYGPSTVREIQGWCGLTRLGPVVERIRADLRTFRDEDGN